jgi:uncharacterized protein YndB with AHSA1/START domain
LQFTIELDIQAPIKEVFKAITEDEEIKQWNKMFIENRYQSEEERDQNRPGTKYTSVMKLGNKIYEVEGELVEHHVPTRTVVRAITKDGVNIATYECHVIDDDTTRVIFRVDYKPKNIFYQLVGLLAGWYQKALHKMLFESLKEYLENRKMEYNIFDYLDELQTDLHEKSLDEIEEKYYKICAKLAGAGSANKIQQIDVSDYINELKSGLEKASSSAKTYPSSKAIFFQYDLDNHWESRFFICNQYNEIEDGDEDWACDWDIDFEGPSFKPFSEIYEMNGFDEDQEAIGSTVYLVARTVISFLRAYEGLSEKSTIPVCIAFHDQEPIYRI